LRCGEAQEDQIGALDRVDVRRVERDRVRSPGGVEQIGEALLEDRDFTCC
jgi:hypothetical protein